MIIWLGCFISSHRWYWTNLFLEAIRMMEISWRIMWSPRILEEKVVFPKMDVIYCRSLWKDVTDFEGLLQWLEIRFPLLWEQRTLHESTCHLSQSRWYDKWYCGSPSGHGWCVLENVLKKKQSCLELSQSIGWWQMLSWNPGWSPQFLHCLVAPSLVQVWFTWWNFQLHLKLSGHPSLIHVFFPWESGERYEVCLKMRDSWNPLFDF